MPKKKRELFNIQRGFHLDYESELSLLALPFFDIFIEDHLDHFYSN